MKKLIIILSIILLTSCSFNFGTKKESNEPIKYSGEHTLNVKYNAKYLKNIPNNNELFLNGEKISSIINQKVVLNGCIDGMHYDLNFKIDDFDYSLKPEVNCKESTLKLGNEASYMISALQFVKDYINAIEYNNDEIKKEALEIIKECNSGDLECYTNKILTHFATSIKYIGDRRDAEHIEGVSKTIETGIGDCEDISIVISSYLENIGIKTKFVVINGHAYSMACGLDSEKVKELVPEDQLFSYYPIGGEECFALEGTLGEDAYIGFDAGYGVEKLVIDPVTKDYSLIDTGGFYENKVVSIEELPVYIGEKPYLSNEKKLKEYEDTVGIKEITLTNNALSPDKDKLIFFKSIFDNDSPKNYARSIVYVYDFKENNVIFQYDELTGIFSNYNLVSWIDNDRIILKSDKGNIIYNFDTKESINLDKTIKQYFYNEEPQNLIITISNDAKYAVVNYKKNSFLNNLKFDHYAIIFDIENNKAIKEFKEELNDEYEITYYKPVFSNNNKKVSFISSTGDHFATSSKLHVYNIESDSMNFIADINDRAINYSQQELEIIDKVLQEGKDEDFANETIKYVREKQESYISNIKMYNYKNYDFQEWSKDDKLIITYPYGEIYDVDNKKAIKKVEGMHIVADIRKRFSYDNQLFVGYYKIPGQLMGMEKGSFLSFGLRTKEDDKLYNFISQEFDEVYSPEMEINFSWHPSKNKFAYTTNNTIYLATVNKNINTDEYDITRYNLELPEGQYGNIIWLDSNSFYTTYNNKIILVNLNKVNLNNSNNDLFIRNKADFKIDEILVGYIDKEAKKVKKDFYGKYDIYHKKRDGLWGRGLYINEELKDKKDLLNIFTYGNNNKYYWMKDNSQSEVICDGVTLPKTEDEGNSIFSKNFKNNLWCLYFEGNEYQAINKPILTQDNAIIYEKCEISKYVDSKKANTCVKLGLYINDKKIDDTEMQKLASGYEQLYNFEDISFDGKYITYSKEGSELYSNRTYYKYIIKEGISTEIKNISNYDNEYDSIEDIKIIDGQLAIVLEKCIKKGKKYRYLSCTEKQFNLYYNNEIYEDISSFNVKGQDVYYTKSNFISEGQYSEDIYKHILLKNYSKITDFYSKMSSKKDYSGSIEKFYNNNFIFNHPECGPLGTVCIINSNDYLVKTYEYYEDFPKEDMWKLVEYYTFNDKKIKTSFKGSYYTYPVINPKGKVDYFIIGNQYGYSWYLKDANNPEVSETLLYKENYPMLVTPKITQ